jgi:hypothetical protein
MAEVKIDDVVYHLDSEFKKALADTMERFAPGVRLDFTSAFKYFRGRVYKHCSVWEKVPDAQNVPPSYGRWWTSGNWNGCGTRLVVGNRQPRANYYQHY